MDATSPTPGMKRRLPDNALKEHANKKAKCLDTTDHSTDIKSDSESDCSSLGECGNCGQTEIEVEFCYGCRCDYCENCAFEGGCGVCDAEENAWENFDEAVNNIHAMLCSKNAKKSITKLLDFMEKWKDAVECGEENILCMSFMGGGTHDADDIMTDCGDAVNDEAQWFLEKANKICKGNDTFDIKFL